MREKLFTTVHDYYETNLNEYTGYHGTYLDYIYVSIHFLYDFDIVNTEVIYVNYSDHLPVLFDFRVKTNDIVLESLTKTLNFYTNQAINNLLNQNLLNKYSSNIYNTKLIKYLNKNIREFLNIDKLKKLLNCDIITIPKGTYICHGTDKICFEIDEYNNLNAGKIPTEDIPKSFCFLHFPFESFMSWYGVNTECSRSRLLIYKLKKDIKVLYLLNESNNIDEKILYRIKSYFVLYEYFYKYYNILPSIEYLHLPENILYGYEIMRILWMFFNHQLLININYEDNKYNENMIYGMLIYDTIQNDFGYFKKNINYLNTVNYWKNAELYCGIELQLFIQSFFTEIVGVYYNNTFYTIEDWYTNYENILHSIEINQAICLSQGINYELDMRSSNKKPTNIQMNRIIKRNLTNLYNFIIQLMNNEVYFNNSIINKMNCLFNKIFHNDINIFKTIDPDIPDLIKIILNEFLLCFINTKYFCPLTEFDNEPLKIKAITDWSNVNIFTNDDSYEEIYNSFKQFINFPSALPDNDATKYIKDKIEKFIDLNINSRINVHPLLLKE